MKLGDKLKVVRSEGISQCYIPYGHECEFIKAFDAYYCVRYEGEEMLINKHLLVNCIEE